VGRAFWMGAIALAMLLKIASVLLPMMGVISPVS
jgi:hypothetical protein